MAKATVNITTDQNTGVTTAEFSSGQRLDFINVGGKLFGIAKSQITSDNAIPSFVTEGGFFTEQDILSRTPEATESQVLGILGNLIRSGERFSFIKNDTGIGPARIDNNDFDSFLSTLPSDAPGGFQPLTPASGRLGNVDKSPQPPSGGTNQIQTAGTATSSGGQTGGFVNIGGAFFEQTSQGLAAVGDPQTLRDLQSGKISSTSQPSFSGGANRFSTGISDIGRVVPQSTPPASAQTTAVARQQLTTGGVPVSGLPRDITTTGSFEDFARRLQPSTPAPSPLNRVDLFQTTRAQQGIPQLETDLLGIRGRMDEIRDEFTQFSEEVISGPAILKRAAQGRISEEERGVLRQLEALQREERLIVDQLNIKNSLVSTLVQLAGQDFNDARGAWEFEYNKNLQIQQAYSTEQNRIMDNARATLNTTYNMMQESGVTFNQLDPVMQSNIRSLEAQAGLPSGTFQAFANTKPDKKIVSTSTRTSPSGQKFADFVVQDPQTGEFSVSSVNLGQARIVSSGGGGGRSSGGGGLMSSRTQEVLDGFTNLNQLTPSEAQDVRSDLFELGFNSSEPPQWFREFIEEQRQQSVHPDFLKQLWGEYKNSILNPPEQDEGGSIEDLLFS